MPVKIHKTLFNKCLSYIQGFDEGYITEEIMDRNPDIECDGLQNITFDTNMRWMHIGMQDGRAMFRLLKPLLEEQEEDDDKV